MTTEQSPPDSEFSAVHRPSGTPGNGAIAAVDLGSNSFHMLVARTDGGEVTTLDRTREMVRLAGGLGPGGELDRAVVERALECLQRFGERLREIPSTNVRAVGTNTLRRVRRNQGFLEQAQDALGHPIGIISGIEEARLIYLGVARSLAADHGRRLVVDIGGGSTELIVGERSQALTMESLYVGCVGITRRFFRDGVDPTAWQRCRIHVLQELEPVAERFHRRHWEEAVGSSGTIRSLQRLINERGSIENSISRHDLAELSTLLVASGDASIFCDSGLSRSRAPVFAGGMAILGAVFEALDIDHLSAADGALREGVLYDLLGRIHHEDTRTRTVESMQNRYHVDLAQASIVASTATSMLNRVGMEWALTETESQVLSQAAHLHEIGLDIAHAHYHKHGGYIIDNADMPGFSFLEQQMVATLVRGHRRKVPLSVFEKRPFTWFRLTVLLRLAALLNRSRTRRPIPEMNMEASPKALRIIFPNGWFEEHPLTLADLQQEVSYLEAAGFGLTVEEAETTGVL